MRSRRRPMAEPLRRYELRLVLQAAIGFVVLWMVVVLMSLAGAR